MPGSADKLNCFKNFSPNSRILLSVASITAAVALVIGATFAFFSDTETSTGNTFTAGALDLKINGQDDPSQIVNITDLKPGDDYFIDKILFVDFNPANVYVHIKDLVNDQGTQTEPEELEENSSPKSDIQNYLTYDLKISDNVIIPFENNVLLPDAASCWIPLGLIPGNQNVTVQQSYHFPQEVTNWAQGDTLTFTEEFLALQINDPTVPVTGTGRVWDPNTKHCVPQTTPIPTPTLSPSPTPAPSPTISCKPADAIFASSSSGNDQGLRKDGSAVLANRSIPSAAFSVPQTSGADSDVGFPVGSFFSLGFPLSGNTASIVFGFSEPFYNGPTSQDLQVFEVTGGSYPDEKVKIEASKDGSTWVTLSPSAIRDETVDLGPLDFANFVRLTDVSTIADFPNDADGYDLDAVKAFCTEVNDQ